MKKQSFAYQSASSATGRLTTGLHRRDFLMGAASLGLAVTSPGLLAGCGGCQPSKSGATIGNLRYMVGEAFRGNWYPFNQATQIEAKINRLLFDRLVEVTPENEIGPGLAESWKQIDERTWELTLRQGVTFHGGQPFTGKDVKASIELASGATGEQSVMAAQWGVPHEVQIVDDRTVRLVGKEPFGPILSLLATTEILCAADIEKGEEALSKAPNGTGPFVLASDAPMRKVLEAFPKYFRGPAKLKTTTWEFVQEPQTRINALLSGQADMVDRVAPEQARQLAGNDKVYLVEATSLEIQLLFLRANKPPFDNSPELRRAVAWGIDRQACARLVSPSTRVGESHLAPGNFFFEAQEPAYRYDPERAKQELAASGHQGPVEIVLLGSKGYFPKSQECSELIAQNLSEVGFQVRIQLLEIGAFFQAMSQGEGNLIYGAWNSAGPDPHMALGSIYDPRGAGGLWGASDETVVAMLAKGRSAIDPSERERVYAEVQSYLWQNVPTLPLFYNQNILAVRKGVQGVKLAAVPKCDFWPIEA